MTSDARDLDAGLPYEIRDRDIGGVLDQAIYLCRDHAKFIGQIIGVLLVPCYLLLGASFAIYTPNAVDVWSGAMPSDTELLISYALGGFSTLVMGLFVVPLTQGALIFGIASRYLGKPATVKESFMYGLSRLGWMVLGNIITGVAVWVGMLFCLIPGLLVSALFFLFPVAVVLERVNAIDALSRSARLLRGFVWNTVALIVVLAIIQILVGGLSTLAPAKVWYQIAVYAIQSVALAFTTVVTVVLYFAARSRVEHLDLELLVSKVDTAPAVESAL